MATLEPVRSLTPDEAGSVQISASPSGSTHTASGAPLLVRQDNLARRLSNRQIQMIAIGGTIGTGLFLGTGKSLSAGGPASLFLTYSICGFLVYCTMLCLCEMSAYMPIAGSFTTYASRFVDEGFGFALTWNYWLNDAISVASDLVAAQMLIEFWSVDFPGWAISLVLFVVIVGANAVGVRMYGELEYSLAVLKVVTIIIFLLVAILVNCGVNRDHEYIGFKNWTIGDAPFVRGFGGFASVFVTASFAFGGTESIGVTAGETKNPRKNIPKVINNVFWRVVLFYLLGTFLIGLNVPYNTPELTEGDSFHSPFTFTFQEVGVDVAAHIMNAVILTSVVSAGNHALFAGTRLLYALGNEGHAPRVFGKLTKNKVPIYAMAMTSLIGCICFATSFIGNGTLWSWLQALVGVSNQIAWVSIGLSSWRFRKAMMAQGRNIEEELPYKNPFHKWAPQFVFFANIALILIQGYSTFVPSANEENRFQTGSFITHYIEIPFLLIMWGIWKWVHKTKWVPLMEMDLDTDRYIDTPEDIAENAAPKKGFVKKALNILV